MAAAHDVHSEIKSISVPSAADIIRRKYLKKLNKHTGRAVILYASSYTIKDVPSNALQIDTSDIRGIMEVLHGEENTELDLIIHSGGGRAEAAEQIVNYLRAKFTHIRVFVPQNAMSAATMLACAADEIVMGKHSALGPIDPQLVINGPNGPSVVAAQSILDEFDIARAALAAKDPSAALWNQKFLQYPPGFIMECTKVVDLSKKLVREWLAAYMFKSDPKGATKAKEIADWLGDNKQFLSHGRAIGINTAIEKHLKVTPLEDDQDLQDIVLSIFHATVGTFMSTNCVKMIESHARAGAFTIMNPVIAAAPTQ